MPELAEVEFYKRQWARGLGQTVRKVHCHLEARIFRKGDASAFAKVLPGRAFSEAHAHGKQLLFRFGQDGWVWIHLGMAGKLECADPAMVPSRHDHFVLYTDQLALAFNDYRKFGAVTFHQSAELPDFWRELPPMPHEAAFTRSHMAALIRRHPRPPIKATLLRQEIFPGIGNWMADEILWRGRIRPDCPTGRIEGRQLSTLHRCVQEVTLEALIIIAPDWGTPPDSWLFNHRWRAGGRCPKTGEPLARETIGGRTTCYSPTWQHWPKEANKPN